MDLMGHQHSTNPVTKADKTMSNRHKKHRAKIKLIKNTTKQLVESNKYNLPHAIEHTKQAQKNTLKLNKLVNSFAKRK